MAGAGAARAAAAALEHAVPCPLDLEDPLGSPLSRGLVTAQFDAGGETDSYTLDIDGGQTVTVRLTPHDGSIQGKVELFDPGNSVLGSASAPAAGATVLLEAASAGTTGTYRIDLTSLAGTGAYEAEVLLSGLLEDEAHGGPANDSRAAAQDLAASSVALLDGADRLAVAGETEDAADDFYAFDLTAGQSASLALASASAEVHVELQDASGAVLALGAPGAAAEHVQDFVAPADGTYYARVHGVAGQVYGLVVTRGAAFDIEANNALGDAQPLQADLQVMGAIDTADSVPVVVEPDEFAAGTVLTHAVPGVTLSPEPWGTWQILSAASPYSSTGTQVFGHTGGGSPKWDGGSTWLRADFAEPFFGVELDVIGDNTGDRGWLRAYDVNDTLLDEVITSTLFGLGTKRTMTIVRDQRDIAYILASGYPHDTISEYSKSYVDDLVVLGGDEDWYTINAAAGDVFDIRTTTPADGGGEPANALDPSIEL